MLDGEANEDKEILESIKAAETQLGKKMETPIAFKEHAWSPLKYNVEEGLVQISESVEPKVSGTPPTKNTTKVAAIAPATKAAFAAPAINDKKPCPNNIHKFNNDTTAQYAAECPPNVAKPINNATSAAAAQKTPVAAPTNESKRPKPIPTV